MKINSIESDFRKKVCDQLHLEKEGKDRFHVFTPFLFDDGDHLTILLKRENEGWFFSDEGHTFMQLTYNNEDFHHGKRGEIIL